MEPAAPGTEDEHPFDYGSLTKQENEQERLLNQKAILKNGQYDSIFELSFVNGAERWFCKVCECPIMGRVYQHELGRRHTTNMQMTNRHLQKREFTEKHEDNNPQIEIAPGEPAPPGFEGEIDNRQALIQERLDGFKVGPLVALEYLIEMQDFDASKEPLYLCLLCDKRGDPRTVLTHLASYNHISQYLQKHFPTCYRALAPYMTKQYKRNWQITLQKIAEAVEKKFGRLRPFSIEKDKFEKERMNFIQLINKGKHFSELTGTTFVELVVHEELTKVLDEKIDKEIKPMTDWAGRSFIEKPPQKRDPSPPVVARPVKKTKPTSDKPSPKPGPAPVRRRSLSSVSSLSSDEDTSRGNRMPRNAMDSSRRAPYERERNYRRRSPTPPRRRSPLRRSPVRRSPIRQAPSPRNKMPWEKGNYGKINKVEDESKLKSREKERQEKLEEFKRLSKAIETDMEKTLKNHERNPEKHPKYNDEWKKFWNRRYKELQSQGKDPGKHDFKPEWIEFWGKKMVELHQEEVKNRKEGLRKRLGLPEEVPPVSFRIGNPTGAKLSSKPNLPMAARPDNDPEIIVIDDKEDDKKRVRSSSPWERESPPKSAARPSQPSKRSISPAPRHRSISRERRSRSRERAPRDRRSRSKDRRSLENRRSLEKKWSPSRGRSSERRSRSRDLLEKRRSRERSRGRRSRSPESYRSGDRRSREKENYKEKDRYSRERSYEKEKKREYRESSFERDLRGRERVRTVADLPWEREKERMMYQRPVMPPEYAQYYGPPPGVMMMRDITRKPVMIPPSIQMRDVSGHMAPEEEEDDGEVNLVSVLRLLTALEERLGSLGPKIIDLLAQALALEKKEANSSEILLDNEINCVMFETVKEKLKGQLLAGLVEPIQERAFKKAIQKTANLIHISEQRRRQRDHLRPKEKAPLVVPGVGKVDKAAIARQVANALIAQGKTDVSQAELEQLINAVIGMAEASRNSSQPVTTASFLDKLTENSEKEKVIVARPKQEDRQKTEFTRYTEPVSPNPTDKSFSNMENLSDSDLQTLLQNFKDLSTEEQMNLINYLKKLEIDEPERVERLRKFVNLGPSGQKSQDKIATIDLETEDDKEREQGGRESPFSHRRGGGNPDIEEYVGKKMVDSEEEDYTYEDVVKSVSKNVQQKEMDHKRKVVEDSINYDSTRKEVDLNDAKALISNLMGNINKTAANSTVDLLGLGSSSSSASDFSKTLGSINIENLASIVNNVQSLTTQLLKRNDEKLKFEPPKHIEGDSRGSNLTSIRNPNSLNPVPGPPAPPKVPLNMGMGPGGPRPRGFRDGPESRPLIQYPAKGNSMYNPNSHGFIGRPPRQPNYGPGFPRASAPSGPNFNNRW